tara:strand:+ start:144 stop:533 length:390 start_codon:yes stop_codon:yes gene_type:complete
MALTVTGFSSSTLTYKLASETNASDSASVDIFGGAGRVHSICFANESTSNAAYLKIKITSGTVTVGTTEPDLMFHLAAAASSSYADRSVMKVDIPNGLSFSQFSFWVTDAPGTSDTGDPGTVTVQVLAS